MEPKKLVKKLGSARVGSVKENALRAVKAALLKKCITLRKVTDEHASHTQFVNHYLLVSCEKRFYGKLSKYFVIQKVDDLK